MQTVHHCSNCGKEGLLSKMCAFTSVATGIWEYHHPERWLLHACKLDFTVRTDTIFRAQPHRAA